MKCFAFLFCLTSFLAVHHPTFAQNHSRRSYRDSLVKGTDSSYIINYEHSLVLRVFGQQKLNSFTVDAPSGYKDLTYKPNNAQNFGVGFSYKWFSLSFGLFKLGSEPKDKGKSSSFDLQSNIYKRKWYLDFMIRNNKGFYIDDKERVPDLESYYTNPNMTTTVIGSAFWRIQNDERFSYRAVMTQNEWQKKSAGSLFYGFEAYYGAMNAHGNIVPEAVAATDPFPQSNVEKLRYFKIGPGVGYGYNLVIQRNFFLSAGITGNLDLGIVHETTSSGDGGGTKINLLPNINARIGAGYNSRDWNINFNYLRNNLPIHGSIDDSKYSQFSGSYRLSFNRRFTLGNKARKKLKPIDDQMDKVDKAVDHALESKHE
ncbi:MAG: DUF4421 domain-containing protein [Chitinophagaceae bacterium]